MYSIVEHNEDHYHNWGANIYELSAIHLWQIMNDNDYHNHILSFVLHQHSAPWWYQLAHCYTLCNTVLELRSLLPFDLSSFQHPYCISITFLSSILTSNLNSIFGTPYTWPCLTLPVPCPFLSTLTKASVILSQTYSSPCCAHDCEGDAADKATIIDYSKTGANKR